MTHVTEDNHGFIWKIPKSPQKSPLPPVLALSFSSKPPPCLRDNSAFKTENTASKLYNRISCLISLAWKPQAPFHNHYHTAVEIQRIFSPKRLCAPLCVPRILLMKVSATQVKMYTLLTSDRSQDEKEFCLELLAKTKTQALRACSWGTS